MLRQQFIDYDLEEHPIQIKTDSIVESGDYLSLVLYPIDQDIEQYEIYFDIKFSDTILYWVGKCTSELYQSFAAAMPLEQEKIWTITKTSTNLIVH